MIRIITTDDLPVKLQAKALDLKIALLRDRIQSASPESKDDIRADLRRAINTRSRITVKRG